ncbi:FAD-dependent oxidoreductase [Actinoplanes oblitus]|uniref:FAD-dependent oxidoreductase n=1 Tax=Actinoplanes oblitus TaxID=3040509 RepID=A0ABY8WNI9_9ACTN|nr:FAD-dependent oxidoreductase [Actinoplanes oblitus]WIM98673.1 FAD-dependent oxidoreductase [Actinoplanes oblitus]
MSTKIVVIGAGYTGMLTAVSLAGRTRRRGDVEITVVNATERFTERLRLHQTATGQDLRDLSIRDLLAGSNARLETGWVTGIDTAARTVRIDDEREIGYDTLIYALGGAADTSAVPGAADHAYTLDSASEADLFARRLTELSEARVKDAAEPGQGRARDAGGREDGPGEGRARDAGGREDGPGEGRARDAGGREDGPGEGRVVVCGSGLTGVEAAAEIAERFPRLTVTLLGRAEPGQNLGPRARDHLRTALVRLGVQVRTGEIIKVRPDGVDLAGGETVPAGAILWTSGVRVSPLPAAAGLTVDDHGRIVVDEALRSVSHPRVWAIGDAAAITQRYGVMHGTCQGGMPTAAHTAAQVVRELDGKPVKPFRFGYYHAPISLGRRDAVVQFTHADDSPARMALTGRAAVWYKETVTASPWPTFQRARKHPASVMVWRR